MENLKVFFFDTGIEYLANLDWRYIITLILFVELLALFVTNEKTFRINNWHFKFKAQYRVLVFGFLIALFFYWLDDVNERNEVLIMFQSMIAAIAIHTWVLKYLIRWIKSKLPEEKKRTGIVDKETGIVDCEDGKCYK